MEIDEKEQTEIPRKSSGPLRLYQDGEALFVTGFGLSIRVDNKEQGLKIIAELEDQGYRICY
jgi:hypothetical protein